MSRDFVQHYQELRIYQVAFESAMRIFEVVQTFPEEERKLLTEQIIRSSRSVCANLAEAWQKRRYEGAFVAKLNDVEAEAAETLTWIEFAILCGYLDAEAGQELYGRYTEVLAGVARLIENASTWVIKGK
jgi:four helix bundle protein